jgi:hypothetical protein
MSLWEAPFAVVLRKPFTPQHPSFSLVEMNLSIQRSYPQGVDAVVFAKFPFQGWSAVPTSSGIIAILIGMINPPSAKVAGSATGRRQYAPFLKPTGVMKFAIDRQGRPAGSMYWELGECG